MIPHVRPLAALRSALAVLVVLLTTMIGLPTAQAQDTAWSALGEGAVVLFRHANAPGTGDPRGFRLEDCATQRNLDASGRAQARRIGEAFRRRGVSVGAVMTSRWCRAMETADLAFPDLSRQGLVRREPAFDSFFDERAEGPARTTAARAILDGWRGPGALVVTTHQVNITALTGIVPASGEGVVLARSPEGWRIAGRLAP
jgi:phosphohistidine phosphatase SixA